MNAQTGFGFLKEMGMGKNMQTNPSVFVVDCARNLLRLCVLCIAICGPLTACAENIKTFKWREEVRLSNGQVIVVERNQEYKLTGGEPFHTAWQFGRERIQATFSTTIPTTVVWEGGLAALSIDMATNGDIYLVTTVQNRQGAREYSVGYDVDYVAFRYIGVNQWGRITMESVPHEMRPNLLVLSGKLFIKDQHPTSETIDLVLKQKVDSDPRIAQRYRSWSTK